MNNGTSILESPIEFLKGVGPMRGELLRTELGIATFEDLLYHFPYRYFDRSQITKIAAVNGLTEFAQFAGILINIGEEGDGRKKRLTATLYDDTRRIELVWFQNINWVKKSITEGERYIVFGKVAHYGGYYNISHPEIEAWNSDTNIPGRQPVYSTTEKLRLRGITNRSFAKITQSLFEKVKPHDIPEILPSAILSQYQLCNRYSAIRWLHYPDTEHHEEMARYRMKWEELFISQILIGRLRLQHTIQRGWIFDKVGGAFNTFFNHHLPFQLTGAQKRVLKEIRQDTATGRQMNRLLQGDVGSGKTIVALMSMLLALDNGFQACIMAPTEILATQHFNSISGLLEEMGITIKLLTGNIKGKERKAILAGLADGSLSFVAGTHALIEDPVIFKNLGLAVIDEQHRFGVGQRAKLWKKNELPPHVLVMTATPIPRTLAMTLYGDLEVSVIDELPPGRQEIKTVHRRDTARAKVMEFMRHEIDKGRQAYIVYPLIEESEKLDYESLMQGYEQVKMWFSEDRYRTAMVHGRMEAELKERNMARFVKGEANILVATTVIEVGVNVPNASVMLLESAERFGLSQMHQLRGRVGRGAEQSYCILMTGSKVGEESVKRINIMVSTTDGFKIAEEDLAMRGPGDMYGTKQSGVLKFKLADIVHDSAILEETRHAALALLTADPRLELPQHQGLKTTLRNHASQSHWAKIS
ncbi:ATP-dependent DNA helicase RecG [Flavipsychrobacter stenotrophus]|uniref:ATP-dependent DNA helicase RecG n=1 Tax=Flavipsychrobacter stenotrophus TaxID=2077091 RepID=A0A2S7SQ36_9BACT|nr:ATP-dependent DNA helicase RecG [Flavipsychrobacter stenotrophus]